MIGYIGWKTKKLVESCQRLGSYVKVWVEPLEWPYYSFSLFFFNSIFFSPSYISANITSAGFCALILQPLNTCHHTSVEVILDNLQISIFYISIDSGL